MHEKRLDMFTFNNNIHRCLGFWYHLYNEWRNSPCIRSELKSIMKISFPIQSIILFSRSMICYKPHCVILCIFTSILFAIIYCVRYWKNFKEILGLCLQINEQLGALALHWVWLLICWEYVFLVLGPESWHF